jgi:polyphosphate kinase
VLLVVRKENDGIRRYVHLGTGNYNAKTARLYVDLGLFTCHPKIGEDVSDLFNSLTGYSVNNGYQKLLVSPNGIRQGLEERIEREIENVKAGHRGHMIFKTNSLTDYGMAEVLYRASQGGVKVELIVRGSCVLVPGVQGLSENITVTSIVGQFLEHDRIYYFYNQGKEEVWLGSADLMPRNLDRRVETVFPVLDKSIREWVVRKLLPAYLKDNQKARVLQSDGSYLRKKPAEDEPPFNCQSWFLEHKTPVA